MPMSEKRFNIEPITKVYYIITDKKKRRTCLVNNKLTNQLFESQQEAEDYIKEFITGRGIKNEKLT